MGLRSRDGAEIQRWGWDSEKRLMCKKGLRSREPTDTVYDKLVARITIRDNWDK